MDSLVRFGRSVSKMVQRVLMRNLGSAISGLVLAATLCLLHAAEEDPLANGVLLVAKPELADPNFRQSVVLITQPVPGGGPLGVILNRPTEVRLSEAWKESGAVPEQFDFIYAGGPVARNQIIYLVRSDTPVTGLRVLDDVYLSGDAKLLKNIVAAEVKVKSLRAYSGYAGWAPRQLQSEIAAGGWYMLPADADTIFTADAAALWSNLIQKITLRSAQYSERGCYSAKNSLTLSIHDFARGLCLPESLRLIASSSFNSSR